jgi:D-alanyl-D-alanine dipeptidase
MGFVDATQLDPSIQAYLVYTTSDNFTGEPLYNSKLTKPWLHPRCATMLIKAQQILRKTHPNLSILILDATRPLEVQTKISKWAVENKAQYYVANPSKGIGAGMHNYGLAVDVTLVNELGQWLAMGSPYDYFGEESNIDREKDLLKNGNITRQEYDNRILLRRIMEAAGFRTITSEWWHFNVTTRDDANKNYIIVDR